MSNSSSSLSPRMLYARRMGTLASVPDPFNPNSVNPFRTGFRPGTYNRESEATAYERERAARIRREQQAGAREQAARAQESANRARRVAEQAARTAEQTQRLATQLTEQYHTIRDRHAILDRLEEEEAAREAGTFRSPSPHHPVKADDYKRQGRDEYESDSSSGYD